VSATESVDVRVLGLADAALVTVGDGEPQPASLRGSTVDYGGETRSLEIAMSGASIWIGESGFSTELVLRDRATQLREHRATMTRVEGVADPDVRSPMPGTVVAVPVASGDSVDVGQTLLTIEAMKMEHKLLASVAGTVHLTVTPGDLVRLDQVVATITPHEVPAARTADKKASSVTGGVGPASEGAQP
jgi:acetyl-CoA/propionyl-CoA carboxylase biotin carboxyl carrier protein